MTNIVYKNDIAHVKKINDVIIFGNAHFSLQEPSKMSGTSIGCRLGGGYALQMFR